MMTPLIKAVSSPVPSPDPQPAPCSSCSASNDSFISLVKSRLNNLSGHKRDRKIKALFTVLMESEDDYDANYLSRTATPLGSYIILLEVLSLLHFHLHISLHLALLSTDFFRSLIAIYYLRPTVASTVIQVNLT